ncbi:hypothetical protein AQJ46_45240 [Streptomyces canus]|uniref:Uncharacterized protein n=1 Tax=Streptomyces canus TaxID=58343 RepID=A0A101RLU7_9ACTN|nr:MULTISPECIES: hypothetical protein [Streptomyces]KUN57919.1 hypothetical protein AQJ46_45240 [Streptomyces canus]MDI5912422.1 hypothetical protein [Streptomyces sp. 12257]
MEPELVAASDTAAFSSVLAAAATAAVTVLGVMFQEWRSRRFRHGRRRILLEDAAQQVAFVMDWWRALDTLNPQADHRDAAKNRGLVWLDEASALVAQARTVPEPQRAALSARNVFLIYRFHSLSAEVIRLCYYAALVWTAVTLAVIPSDAGTEYFVSDFAAIAAYVVVALLLRAWAIRVNRSRNPETGPADPASDSQLL